MTVERKNTEIEDQPHKMWAEGTSLVMPLEQDAVELLAKEGWRLKNFSGWFDEMMGFYRWNCDIEHNNSSHT